MQVHVRTLTRARLSRRREGGASAVEFALVMPILLLIVFGIINFGVVFAQELAISNSARQAARYGVVDDRDCGDIITDARNSANTILMNGNDATKMSVAVGVGQTETAAMATPFCTGSTTAQPCQGSDVGDNVYVRMEFDTEALVPLVPVPDVLDGKGVFRCEFS